MGARSLFNSTAALRTVKWENMLEKTSKPHTVINTINIILKEEPLPKGTYHAMMRALRRFDLFKRALDIFEKKMPAAGLKYDIYSFSHIMKAIDYDSSRHLQVVELLRSMPGHGLRPNVVHYTIAIEICEKANNHDLCLELFAEMVQRDIEPDAGLHAVVLYIYQKRGEWQRSIGLLERMQAEKKEVTSACYAATILACAEGGAPMRALEVFRVARKMDRASAFCHLAALKACGDDVQLAEGLLSDMLALGEKVGGTLLNRAFHAMLNVYTEAKQGQKAFEMFAMMVEQGLHPTSIVLTTMLQLAQKTHPPEGMEASDWYVPKAKELLLELAKHSPPRTEHYVYAIRCCWRGRDGDTALAFLAQSQAAGVKQTEWLHSSVVQALGAAGQWQKAVQVFQGMFTSTDPAMKPKATTFSTILWVLESHKQLRQAQALYEHAYASGHFNHWLSKSPPILDLTQLSKSVGALAVHTGLWELHQHFLEAGAKTHDVLPLHIVSRDASNVARTMSQLEGINAAATPRQYLDPEVRRLLRVGGGQVNEVNSKEMQFWHVRGGNALRRS